MLKQRYSFLSYSLYVQQQCANMYDAVANVDVSGSVDADAARVQLLKRSVPRMLSRCCLCCLTYLLLMGTASNSAYSFLKG